MAQSLEKKVLERAYQRGRGWAFSQSDLVDLATRDAIDKALARLAEKSAIRRIQRGLYDYPRRSELLGEPMGPDIHQVARALARKFNWRIQPGGAAALSLIGLSTQVPARYLYLSDGPDRAYTLGTTTLAFKHQALKDTGFRHEESAVVVQALKALGEKQVSDEVIERIRAWLPAQKRQAVLKDTRGVTGWVYEAIKRICREDEDG